MTMQGDGGARLALVGRLGRGHNHKAIQGKYIPHPAGQGQVTSMHRIKSAAEYADGLHRKGSVSRRASGADFAVAQYHEFAGGQLV